jgi:HAD superfamily hydrolase (TIGR01509 family)
MPTGLRSMERRSAPGMDDGGPFRQPFVRWHGAQPLGLQVHGASRFAGHRYVYTIAAVPVRAFLFDFDGLILDTETASRAGWQWLYRQHGHELPPEKWALMVGTIDGWDIWGHLEGLVGSPLDRETWNERRYAHEVTLLEAEELRPGIAEYLAYAEAQQLKRAIVSSASRRWVDMHLERLERSVGWDAIITADLDPVRAKPRPTLYLEALEALAVPAEDAVAFEDSPNGARAARAAGVYVVGIPNAVTADLGLAEAADIVVESLADLSPDELVASLA